AALTFEQQRARAEEYRLAQARDENANALARFRQRLSAQTARRDALSQDAEALGKLLARLKDEATKRRFEVRPGALPWPLEGRILHAFGAPLPPAMARANGLQLGARAGTPVRAVASGEVVFSNWLRGFGLMIIVDHGAGWLSLYGQAESLLYGEGQRVEAGEVIATAGRSGGAAATGLWFELRQNGTPQDPLRWCLARS
ncbi:MAG: peptidoglycan DD-metalloendopeptidase family protein, partial [Proteobacteria bacterium]|nr:peptidoglycan DD-metalloendopeptidase family protein [Pseudomonadota bacterium]